MNRWFFALALMVIGLFPLQGCVVYPSTPQQPATYAPSLSLPTVTCAYDSYYAEHYWYFEVRAQDGDRDVQRVGVDVYDGSGHYLETQDLYYYGGDTWSVTVFETYSQYLDCRYPSDFQFVFWAEDSYGNVAELSVGAPAAPYSGPSLSLPYVECGYDPYYADSYWYFEVEIYDPQGVADVHSAVVDVYFAGDDRPIEQWPLYYDANYGVWYTTVYEYYSAYLDCRYPGDFAFQFLATDRSGQLGYVNATDIYVY